MIPAYPVNRMRALRRKTMCLMAGTGSSKSSVSSFKYEHDENNYYELLDAFNELHKEATKLQKSNNKRRGEIKWLESRIKQLEEENENLMSTPNFVRVNAFVWLKE